MVVHKGQSAGQLRPRQRQTNLLNQSFIAAENLIVINGNAASRINNSVAQFPQFLSLNRFRKEFCMSREAHLAALAQRHEALEKEIAQELMHPAKDELKLAEMKRRKLQLKDEMAKLQAGESTPQVH
jgi:hypothetical protein